MKEAVVIGAGLAGCEAAYQLSKRGIHVKLIEMKPLKYSEAHHSEGFAELVCSNSLRSDALTNAVGLLKEEMRTIGSVIMHAADENKVPAGSALAVDRDKFSAAVTKMISEDPNIEIVHEEKETIATGSAAAAHGGFTSVFAMPNLIPCPDDPAKMKSYLKLINENSIVHTYPYAPITIGEAGKQLCDIAGIEALGVKWFSDDGVGMNDPELMKKAMQISKEQGILIACHTEDMQYRKPGASVHEAKYAEENGWIGIPDECESEPLKRDLQTAEEIHGRYHACHISSHLSVEAIAEAKRNHADVSGEVTAHHLLLENTDVKGTNWKMNPPLRTHQDRMSLIEGLEDGTLDFIASDHGRDPVSDTYRLLVSGSFEEDH